MLEYEFLRPLFDLLKMKNMSKKLNQCIWEGDG
jgi:hypothetical protein